MALSDLSKNQKAVIITALVVGSNALTAWCVWSTMRDTFGSMNDTLKKMMFLADVNYQAFDKASGKLAQLEPEEALEVIEWLQFELATHELQLEELGSHIKGEPPS